MKRTTSLLLVIILSIGIFSCSTTNEDKLTRIAILHTNDMHASINNMDKLAAYKQEIEKQYDHVLLISAGDIFSGNPVVDVYKEKGYPMIDLMNKLGYKVSALGNHEFDYGQEILAERMKQAQFPFICANMDTRNTNVPQPEPYVVLKAGDRNLLFLSLIEIWNDGLPSTHPEKLKGMEFQDPAEAVLEYLELHSQYDAFIGLTHLGYRADKQLAEKHPEFDLIIGGHSHSLIDSAQKINNTWVTQAGDDVNYAGKVVLTFQGDSLLSIKPEVINLKGYEKENEEIAALIEKYNNNETLQETIGMAMAPIQGKEELGSLFTDAQVEMHNLDFSFQNNGGIRISEIPKGEIKVSTIYELDPFGNELILFKMTPKEIKSLLGNTYERSHGPGLQIGGGSYTLYIDSEENLEKIVIRDEHGNTLHPDSTYTVGLNSYISSSYTFDHTDEGKSTYTTTAQNLIEYIRKKEKIDYSGVKRIFVEEIR